MAPDDEKQDAAPDDEAVEETSAQTSIEVGKTADVVVKDNVFEPEKKQQKSAEEYRRELRLTDRRAKQASARVAELEAQMKEREDADKSEQDKAIEKAREEGRTTALTEAQKERRQDRLEVAATRLAAKGIEVGDDTVKFADPDDALVHVERAIRSGDVDEADIYDDDNKVKPTGLRDALADILERKPHLVYREPESGRPQGSSDAGRGQGGGKSLEEMSPDDHLKAIQGRT